MKIFEVEQNAKGGNETDWVIVNHVDEIMPLLKEEMSDDYIDGHYDGAKITEVKPELWDQSVVTLHGEIINGEADPTLTFKEYVEWKGASLVVPSYLCGTVFQ